MQMILPAAMKKNPIQIISLTSENFLVKKGIEENVRIEQKAPMDIIIPMFHRDSLLDQASWSIVNGVPTKILVSKF